MTARDWSASWLRFAAFFAMMSVAYLEGVAPHFAYRGYVSDPDIGRMLLSLGGLALLPFAAAGTPSTRNFLVIFVSYAYVVPALILFSMGGLSRSYALVMAAGTAILFLAAGWPARRPTLGQLERRRLMTLLLMAALGVFAALILSGGAERLSFDISRIYELRRAAAEATPGLLSYLTAITAKVLIPFGIALSLHFRARSLALVFLVLALLFFGLSQHKSTLAAAILAWLLFEILSRRDPIRAGHLLFLGIGALAAAEALWRRIQSLEGPGFLNAAIIRRIFFVPPKNDSHFVSFFSENPAIRWATSRITFGLIENPYSTTPSFLIGAAYGGSDQMSANSGFVASGFANGGPWGVMLYAALIGLIIAQINAHGRHLGHALTISASTVAVVTAITTSDLITTLLTHGLGLLLVLLALTPQALPAGGTR